MAIKKDGDRWLVDLYPQGRSGKRVRKKFDTRSEAARFEKFVLAQAAEGKEWNGRRKDIRKLTELVDLWYQSKGVHLKDGPKRKRYLGYIAEALNDPIACELKAANFVAYVSERIESGLAEKTLNNHLGYLKAVYNYLHSIGEIEYQNPLERVKPIRIDEKELSWLTTEQIQHLLKVIAQFSQNPHVLLLTKICLATGARWSEAEGLKLRHVRDGKVSFHGTKSGKSRSIPIADELYQEANHHLKKYGEFSFSLSAFRRALDESKIELPKGQAAHVLRHTFASHFMMSGGNILTLQKILGHSSITVTMRYAHLSPDHLNDAKRLNPLGNFNGFK